MKLIRVKCKDAIKLIRVKCKDVVSRQEAIEAFSNFAVAGKKPIKRGGGPRNHVSFEWRFPGIIFNLTAFPGKDENFNPMDAYVRYSKQGIKGYDKDKFKDTDALWFGKVEEGKKILLELAQRFEQRLKQPQDVEVSLSDFDRYFDKLKIHNKSSMTISSKVNFSVRRWEYPGLKLYVIYDLKNASMSAKWEKRKLKGYKEDTFGEEGSRSFSTLHEGGKILLQFAKQFEQRLDRPVKELKRPSKTGEELTQLEQTFNKMFGYGSKFENYGMHRASYATSNALSAWDYYEGDIVLVLGNKGGMELETAFGDRWRFKAGDFDGVKRKLEKVLKDLEDEE